mgnify:CR=1 FL=1
MTPIKTRRTNYLSMTRYECVYILQSLGLVEILSEDWYCLNYSDRFSNIPQQMNIEYKGLHLCSGSKLSFYAGFFESLFYWENHEKKVWKIVVWGSQSIFELLVQFFWLCSHQPGNLKSFNLSLAIPHA